MEKYNAIFGGRDFKEEVYVKVQNSKFQVQFYKLWSLEVISRSTLDNKIIFVIFKPNNNQWKQ